MLDQEEAALAKILLKNRLVTEEAFDKYIEFKKLHDETGKTYLGEILINLGYITKSDTEEFMEDNNRLHLKFCDTLAERGFLTQDQKKMIYEKYRQTGRDVITLFDELNIMTRDNFSRAYNKHKGIGMVRLGEWLVLNERVTRAQIDRAIDLQKIHGIAEFMVFHQYCPEGTMKKVLEKLSGMALKIKTDIKNQDIKP